MAKKKTRVQSGLPPRLNQAFDARMLQIGVPGRTKLTRGHIRHAPNNVPCFGSVGFLYNPSSISVSHSIDPSQAPSAAQGANANLDQLANTVGIGDVTIPLLFDRTYEVWQRKDNFEPSQFGVYHDVAAFYALIGITGAHSTNSSALAQVLLGPNQIMSTVYPIKPATPTMVYAQIGASLKFYGQITSLGITYTHWSEDMIPMRCAVDVGLMLLSDPNAGSRVAAKQKGVNSGASGGVGGLLTQGVQ